MSYKEIALAEITVEKRHRKVDQPRVASLAESIEEIGLLNPLVVRKADHGFILIAGAHRKAACEKSGWKTAPCNVVDLDDLRAELAEIDENLERQELTVLDRAKQVARRKELFLALNPAAAERAENGGGRPNGGDAENGDTVSQFVADTAKKSGRTGRSVQRDARIGKGVTDEVTELIKGSPVADSTSKLSELAGLSPKKQMARAKAMLKEIEAAKAQREKPKPAPEKVTEDDGVDPAKVQRAFGRAIKSISALRRSLGSIGFIGRDGEVDPAVIEQAVRLGKPVLGRRHSTWTNGDLRPVAEVIDAMWETARVQYLGQRK